MSIWSDIGLPDPYPIEADELELIVEAGRYCGVRYGKIELRDMEAERKLLSARDRRRLRRGMPLRPDREKGIKLRHAIGIGMDIAQMSNHARLEFFTRAGKTPVARRT